MPPLRVGLVGAGRWGTVYLNTLAALPDRYRLTHLCTRDPRNAQRYPGPVTVTTNWREVVASCEAVIIATPPAIHAEMLEACIDAGTPCIVEKPLCLDLETAERLHQQVQRSGVSVLVDHLHLFNPAYQALTQELQRHGEPVERVVSEGMGVGPFRRETSALWDWAPHDVSVCLDLFKELPGACEVLGGPVSPEGRPELAAIRLEFSRGAAAWIHVGASAVQKRRLLGVWTEHRLYRWDDLVEPKLSWAKICYAERYEGGVPQPVAWSPLPYGLQPPVAAMLTYFAEGLAGGDRRLFGTALAREVVRCLAACEDSMQRSMKS